MNSKDANAKLTALAPELLASLRELVNRCDGPDGVTEDGSNIETINQHALLNRLENNHE